MANKNPSASDAKFPVETIPLFQPCLEELAEVLQDALSALFARATVSVVDCPDLSRPPFNLAAPGLGGSCSLLDVGSSSYLAPRPQRERLYDLREIARAAATQPAFLIGAGLGPWPHVGTNCELIANVVLNGDSVYNQSRCALVDKGQTALQRLPDAETRGAILLNLFCCKGQPGKVLKVLCAERKGDEDIITCMRAAIYNQFKEKPVGLGGVFLLTGSRVKQHIMPDFPSDPMDSAESLQAWITFHEQAPPLVAVGTLVSTDPGLGLKIQHFHGYNSSGEGGHFYSDTEPQKAEYEGYFSLGQFLHRMDHPL